MPDPIQPNDLPKEGLDASRQPEGTQASGAEVAQATGQSEQPTKGLTSQTSVPPTHDVGEMSWFYRHGAVILYMSVVVVIILLLGLGAQRGAKVLIAAVKAASNSPGKAATAARTPVADPVEQANAVRLLESLAGGDRGAADEIAAHSADWMGNTRPTQRTDQLLNNAINSNDMRIREASLQAQLALEGIPENEAGLERLTRAVANPRLRIRAFWMLGALGNRGVDPVHVAKILESYLADPGLDVRSWAINGLSLVATDETIPMLLDRFRNDPSPVVQERAICGLAQSGMYSHAQRMVAAKSLVGWLDDALLTSQQHAWAIQALHDIASVSPSSDSAAAWREWWSRNSGR